ncbi:hypothetical protein B4916_22565, partial [Yersinia intermedia]
MNKHVALLLAPGFEEAEAIIILDVLARMDINVTTLACDPSKTLNVIMHYPSMQMHCLSRM